MYNTVEAILARILSKTFCLQDCVNRIWTWWQNWKKWAGRQVWGKTGNNGILTKQDAEIKMFLRTLLFYQCYKYLIFPALACRGVSLLNIPSKHWCRNSKKKRVQNASRQTLWHILEFVKCGYSAVLVTYPHITQSNGPEKEHFAPKAQLWLVDLNGIYFFLEKVSQPKIIPNISFQEWGSEFFGGYTALLVWVIIF